MTQRQLLSRAAFCLTILGTSVAAVSAAQFASGTGEPNAPYQIATPEQLIALGNDPKWRHVYRPAVLSCFWDGEASRMARGLGAGADAQGGLTRLTTAQMRTAASFRNFGWDFETVWTIRESEDYPRLRWERQSPIDQR